MAAISGVALGASGQLLARNVAADTSGQRRQEIGDAIDHRTRTGLVMGAGGGALVGIGLSLLWWQGKF